MTCLYSGVCMRTGQTEEKEEHEALFELNKYILKKTQTCVRPRNPRISQAGREPIYGRWALCLIFCSDSVSEAAGRRAEYFISLSAVTAETASPRSSPAKGALSGNLDWHLGRPLCPLYTAACPPRATSSAANVIGYNYKLPYWKCSSGLIISISKTTFWLLF